MKKVEGNTFKRRGKLVILDRDGVINVDSPEFIKSEAEWQPIPGSLEAIATLNQYGYQVVVATNQSGIARGYYDIDMLQRIHKKMQEALHAVGGKIDAIYVCPHGTDDNCDCRKPKIGLYNQIAKDYNLDFSDITVPAIGDSLRDLESAETAGCKAILVLTGNGKKTAEKLRSSETALHNADIIPIYADLKRAVLALLNAE